MWFRSFKRIEDPDFRLLSLAIFAAFSAYFIQNLFSFGVAAINTVLYLFMAFQAFVYAEYYPRKTTVIPLYNAGASAALSYLMQACMIVLSVFVAYRAYILYDADVDYNRGKMLGSINNRWDLAIEEHIKSVQKCPGEVKYHVYLGLAYERLAMMTQDSKSRLDILQKAAQAYQEGTSLNPGNSYYWGNLGRIYMLMGQLDNPEYYKKAEEYYIIAINKAPVTGLFYNNLLDLYVKTGRMDSVDPLLEKVSLYDKQLGSNACFSIGNLYFGNKDVRRAEYYYMKSVELKPDFQYGLFNLGVAAAAVGDTFTSVSSLEKLMDMNPAFEKKDEALRIISNITRKRR
jgi:tetratricopeptide (TPR) repeat protein